MDDNTQPPEHEKSRSVFESPEREESYADMRADSQFDACNDPVYDPTEES
ncbi:hypothetical protein M3P05_10360 [Sansalvadorimonas sp. 2012CJ34-2]|uniref:Uncharacterized protein n=1 Tax=Parendozoicomonas callyspongiae TaxID=2942213 RepID=A0ABT0PHU9_9GAMM|nr:hypothetical protein [Sansalvadorimonas sp. 2012CJ34-2]MCL6270322.1 hypothetical protein [Sansalvadorimonas sp. 2012CJ34-2]